MRRRMMMAAAGRDRIPTDGLVVWYTMDNISGSTLVDEMGNYDGTITGATQTSGVIGQALSFDGNDDIVNLPVIGISGNSARSVSAWIYSNSLSNVDCIFASGTNTSGQAFTLEINRPASGQIYFEGWGQDISTSSVITASNWHHIVLTYDGSVTGSTGSGSIGSGLTVYLDSVGIAWDAYQFGSSGALSTLNDNYGIGDRPYAQTLGFGGLIDQVRIYNRALSESEIELLYNEGA